MKRRLQKIYWLGIGATLLVSLIAVALMISLKIHDTREDMRSILNLAGVWTRESNADFQTMADDIAEVSPWLRATFVMDYGLVLADSDPEAEPVLGKNRGPEIDEAIRSSYGDDLRFSGREKTFILYVAGRIAPNLILRLSYPLDEIRTLIFFYAVGLIVLFFLVYFPQRVSFARFQADLLRQMKDIQALFAGEKRTSKAVFPEMQPSIDHIAYQAQRLNEDLEEVQRTLKLRSDFVANASHELRSPLTSVMGFAEMLDEGLADTPEEQKVCVSTIRTECKRMLEVIEDILLLSRAEKAAPVQLEEVDVSAIAGDVISALAHRTAARDIKLSQEGALTVPATEKAIWEILYNLTDNAIHYGREGGYVRVLLEEKRITVEDNGVGVQEEHLPHLTEQFYRVDEARSMSSGGSGLGLSIVRALAEQIGAALVIQSVYGEGSRFIIDFAPEKEVDACPAEPC